MPVPEDAAAAYLRRLAVAVRPAPTLTSLHDLVSRHLQCVPFENLDIVAGAPHKLGTARVLRKVAVESRGGFCFELNEAFRWLLANLGFSVRRIEARVWQARTQRFGAPFDHLALVVSLAEGEFLVDVGYGDGPRAPMRFPRDRVRDLSGDYCLEPGPDGCWRLASQSQILYDMTVSAQSLAAFAPMCRYHQTSPESLFAQGLICTRATPTGRVTLSGRRLITVAGGQRTEHIVADVGAALQEHFSTRLHPRAARRRRPPREVLASC